MKKTVLHSSLLTLATCAAPSAFADAEKIRAALTPFHVTNMEVTDSPIAGLKTVVADQGIFYASEDGRYFLQGRLVEITPAGDALDVSNRPLLSKLNALKEEMIVYPAAEEKYVVTVFTDITCPFCVRLHQHIPEYNAAGITIRYLAFPRAGAQSNVAKQLETLWKSENKAEAMNHTMLNGKKPTADNDSHMVARHYALGVQLGISGTPALVLEDGSLVEGYRPPKDLAALLEQSAQ